MTVSRPKFTTASGLAYVCDQCRSAWAASAKAMGATHKRSTVSADHDHDDFCDLAEQAGEVDIDFDYGGGLKMPLYHPRCQCSMSFYWRKKPKTTVN